MFSGIIEATSRILALEMGDQSLKILVERPSSFDDLKLGDSIAVNGVCLTVEEFDSRQIQFSLGAETLKVLEMNPPEKTLGTNLNLNLERSMKFGDRIHGHLVSGHVDFLGTVTKSEALGDSWILSVQLPSGFQEAVWKKGSITIQGVSLTVNDVRGAAQAPEVEVCLIPETIKRTNLAAFKIGERINIELDWMAKGLMNALNERLGART